MEFQDQIDALTKRAILIGPVGKMLGSTLLLILFSFNGYVWTRLDGLQAQHSKASLCMTRVEATIRNVITELNKGGRFTCEQAMPLVRIVEAMLNRNEATIDFSPNDLKRLTQVHAELSKECGSFSTLRVEAPKP